MPLFAFEGHEPRISAGAWIAPTATLVGDVLVEDEASVWYGAVLRADFGPIIVRRGANIQDGSVLHVMKDEYPLILGDDITVGHSVTLHGCTIESRCLIGMRATLLNGVVVGEGSIVAAGTLLTERTIIPPRSLVFGSPGKVKRTLTAIDQATIDRYAQRYVEYKDIYRGEMAGDA